MSLGFVPYLLMQSKDVFQNATPSRKITPPGFLKMLLSNSQPQVLSKGIDDGSGHVRDVKVKYRTRIPAGKTSTTDDCSIDAIPAYTEASIPATLFRKYSIHLDDETIAKYEAAASGNVGVGKPATGILSEIWDALIEAANGLFADINADLISAQASAFGKNVVSGAVTARTVNFPLDQTVNNLGVGMTMVMNDAMLNEVRLENARIVGNGLVNNYYLQQPAKGVANNGLDTSRLALPQFFFDPYTASGWGANQFGIFEKDAVQLINVNRFDGFRGGDKMTTILGTITLPVVDSLSDGQLSSFKFDFQVKYIDCPTSVTIGGNATSVKRGWVLSLMASYNLFNIPNDAYDAADRLTGNNGTFRYTATNS